MLEGSKTFSSERQKSFKLKKGINGRTFAHEVKNNGCTKVVDHQKDGEQCNAAAAERIARVRRQYGLCRRKKRKSDSRREETVGTDKGKVVPLRGGTERNAKPIGGKEKTTPECAVLVRKMKTGSQIYRELSGFEIRF